MWRSEMEDRLEQIQKLCLGIVLDIDRVCRENQIHYSLCGGSVIGMHLYGGYIPWDDDIDLMMTRKNYDRFLRIYPEKCDPRYHLHHYSTDGPDNLPALFSRVEDTRTHMTEEIAGARRQGHVFVDVTVYDHVPDRLTYACMRLYAGCVYAVLYRRNGMTPGRKWWKKALFRLVPVPRTREGVVKLYAGLEARLRRLRRKRLDGNTAELLSAAFSGILYREELFDHYRNCRFEGHKLMVIRDYMDYLYTRYGKREFVKEMPGEDRQPPHILELSIET